MKHDLNAVQSVPSEFFQPAEWEKHESVWLAWPSHEDLWQELLPQVQSEFTALCRAICDIDHAGNPRGERLNILVPDAKAHADANKSLSDLPVTFYDIAFGDIWLRDTAPIFLKSKSGKKASVRFQFNGWGNKYSLPDDPKVSAKIAKASDTKEFKYNWVLEGGALEVDGEGTCLTTRQCMLNPNRNPNMNQDQLETTIGEAFGVKKVLWLGDGLINDHTDGHIDTLVRFSKPGEVLCMVPMTDEDPHAKNLLQIEKDLKMMTDAQGRKLQVHTLPSPGLVLDEGGEVMPASYLNYYISNTRVIVPIYGSPYDDQAVKAIGAHFPGRETIGLMAKGILGGGGAFHCISQQVPV